MDSLFTPLARFRLQQALVKPARKYFSVCERGFLDDEGIPVSDADMLDNFAGTQVNVADVLVTQAPGEESFAYAKLV